MRRGEAPVAVDVETCVLGHAWQDGLVLCPVCGFGRRAHQTAVDAETVTVTAVVAMPAAREGEVTSATVSPDGHWAWDGDEWVPASMSTIGATASAASTGVQDAATIVPRVSGLQLESDEAGTWASPDVPSSLQETPPEPSHEPSHPVLPEEPQPVPMRSGPRAVVPAPRVVETAASRAAAAEEAQTLDDLARLLALADVPDSALDAVLTDFTVEDAQYVVTRAPDTPVRNAPVRVAPIPVAPVEAAPVEAAPVEKAPVEKAPVETASVDTGPVDTAPVDTAPVDAEPVDTAPVDTAPVDTAPVDTAPVDTAPVDTAPVDTGPVDTAPVDAEPVDAAPVDTAPVDAEPVDGAPDDAAPVADLGSTAEASGGDALLAPDSEIDGRAEATPAPVETDTAPEPAAAADGTDATETTDETDETGARPRRSLRLGAPDLHLGPNGLRAAVVVLAAVVSTVVATGHSPFAHHASAAPRVDTLLQGTLRSAAMLETRYASEHGNAVVNAATLTPGGYRAPSLVSLRVARTSGQGFCLVGSGPVAGTRAFELWDSARGGLVSAGGTPVSFPTVGAAQLACRGAGAFTAL